MNTAELKKLSLAELQKLNKDVIAVIKLKRQEKALDVKDELYVGAEVKVNHPKLAGKVMEVLKINRTKAKLGEPNGTGIWNVPLSMIIYE